MTFNLAELSNDTYIGVKIMFFLPVNIFTVWHASFLGPGKFSELLHLQLKEWYTLIEQSVTLVE